MRWMKLAVVSAALSLAGGCASTEGMSLFKNRDYKDPTDGADDPWTAQAGAEGRGGRPKEKSEDPRWLRELTMSDRAREIENNLGISD